MNISSISSFFHNREWNSYVPYDQFRTDRRYKDTISHPVINEMAQC